MHRPILYIFAGLPGTGKSTLAQRLAGKLGCAYVRIDTIEQALRDLCSLSVEAEGYQLAYRLASDNLKIGVSVVADSCNTVEVTRKEWEDLARSSNADFLNIEVSCSDASEHQRRVETRVASVPGLRLPTWPEVKHREYEAWIRDRITIDTCGKTVDDSLEELCHILWEHQKTKVKIADTRRTA